MKKLCVEMTNCYGIKHLKAIFDFSKTSVYAVYAPNGAMKSSFARTFEDISEQTDSKDRIFPDRKCQRHVTDENGTAIPHSAVFVVSPYDEVFGHTEKTSLLLVNEKLRVEYEKLHATIAESETAFIAAMKEQSKSKRDLRREISSTFTRSPDSFFVALARVKDEVAEQPDAPWADIEYDRLFDEKAIDLLGNKDIKAGIADYVARLNELLDASVYFKKGVFNYYNGATIAKNLADNGFFDAKHTVRLNATETIEITSREQLEDLINEEKEAITRDAKLKKLYGSIAKAMEKNVQCREFQEYLSLHDELLPKLANIEGLREEVWKSYFKACYDQYRDLLDRYQAAEKRRKEIEAQAAKERSQWEAVIDIFNDRFVVPFTLNIKNRTAIALRTETAILLEYDFNDGADHAPVDKETLLKTLSTGEKKALYVLNIIFEVEARKKAGTQTLFVFDDIADSFDYKNKYAIIQYLHDISTEPLFKQIVLTHNFDFFRTVHGRFVPYQYCRMAFKDSTGLTFVQASGINNVFVNDWKKNFFNDRKKKVASIPFIRNIVEYTKGDSDPDYMKLTSLLHWKSDSASITVRDLDDIFKRVFATKPPAASNGKEPVMDVLKAEAMSCLNAGPGLNLDNKVVLAIATRIAAEQFMVGKINDSAFVTSIDSNQTWKLLERFEAKFPKETSTIRKLRSVMLMTPENIHLNSFMYEPILDMSDEHLRKLFQEVLALK